MVTEIRESVIPPIVGSGNGKPVSLSHALPSLENGWPPRSFQIVSLYDVLRLNVGMFLAAFLTALRVEQDFREICEQGLGASDLDASAIQRMDATLNVIVSNAEKLQIQRVLDRAQGTRFQLKNGMLTFQTAQWELKELREGIHSELYKRKVLTLDSEHGQYFNLKHPFGEVVYNNFESARYDIREAANCYATNRATACVFHLTRVLQIGLISLAKHLNVTFVDIASENWETIINKIEGEIKIMRQAPRSTQKAADLEFYAGVAKQFRYFKETWRNPIAHYLSVYDDKQALSAMGHVEEFMRDIAGRGLTD